MTHHLIQLYGTRPATPGPGARIWDDWAPPADTPASQIRMARRLAEKAIATGLAEPPAEYEVEITGSITGVPVQAVLDVLREEEQEIRAIDWKTCTGTTYIMPEETMMLDPQVLIYGSLVAQLIDHPRIVCTWVYLPKDRVDSPAVLRSVAHDSRTWLRLAEERLAPTLQEIVADSTREAPVVEGRRELLPTSLEWINENVPAHAQLQEGGTCYWCDYAAECGGKLKEYY